MQLLQWPLTIKTLVEVDIMYTGLDISINSRHTEGINREKHTKMKGHPSAV
jgi:hypothetical protein